ncbi:MAG TPA: 50S ribosomal protein L6, partial [Pirellulales bacterium]|nr:50S ribosomal protein L6 [Pirellulales bacterium]
MSRIGKQPVVVPSGVKVAVANSEVSIEGAQGKLSWKYHSDLSMQYDEANKQIVVTRRNDTRQARALHGLGRALVQNMVVGVTKGYEKKLEIVGVGYLAAIQKGELQLRVGFANEVHLPIPKGLTVTCPDQTHVV